MNFAQLRFDLACSGAHKLLPLRTNREDVCLVTLLCHSHLTMYVLAARTFCRNVGFVPEIVVLNDGSLTEKDYRLLNRQFPDIFIVHVGNINMPDSIPRGGSWERLYYIAEKAKLKYVIQLDADTLSFSRLYEVIYCINNNMNFMLQATKATGLVSVSDVVGTDNLVQGACETQLRQKFTGVYARGNSGFAGFSKGSKALDNIESVARKLKELVGDQIYEWGSEQVASNLLLSNYVTPYLLASSLYCLYWGNTLEKVKFVHFIGRTRFKNRYYLNAALLCYNILRLASDKTTDICTDLRLKGSRLRGEGSRLQVEASRLKATNIPELIEVGNTIYKLGGKLSRTGDVLFARSEKKD